MSKYYDEYISFHNSVRESDLEQKAELRLIFVSNYKKEILYITFSWDLRLNVSDSDMNWGNFLLKKPPNKQN